MEGPLPSLANECSVPDAGVGLFSRSALKQLLSSQTKSALPHEVCKGRATPQTAAVDDVAASSVAPWL